MKKSIVIANVIYTARPQYFFRIKLKRKGFSCVHYTDNLYTNVACILLITSELLIAKYFILFIEFYKLIIIVMTLI